MVFNLEEYQAELHDDPINFLGHSKPKLIKYLNVSDFAMPTQTRDKEVPFKIVFQLSQNVHKQKRVVFDIFMMLGEVGGLNDFFVLTL